jgi:hypothetical protein
MFATCCFLKAANIPTAKVIEKASNHAGNQA